MTGQKIEEKKYTKWLDYDRIRGESVYPDQKDRGLSCDQRTGEHKETEPLYDR